MDLLVRDMPENVVAALDTEAERLGLSRSESLRRILTQATVRTGHSVTVAELVGFSARSGGELRSSSQRPPLSLLPVECMTPAAERRAVEVQQALADRGLHRAPSIRDQLIAAVAERSGLTVLHVDKDFDVIAEITGQSVETLRLP